MVTRKAAIPIHANTADWRNRCFTGVAVRSRTIDADIIIVKMTATIEFSGPNIRGKIFT